MDNDDGGAEGSAMHTWVAGPVLGFDTETTGVDPRTDRIVTAALVLRDGEAMRQRTWLIDPGVEIPDVASDIHGITTDHARAEGAEPRGALEEIAGEVAGALAAGVPVVAYNAAYDLTLLDEELTRWQLPTLGERLGRAPGPVIDPLVLDRGLDRVREGRRALGDLCTHYGVETADPLHTAEVDVLATLRLLDCLVAAYPELGERTAEQLHEWQRACHRQWAADVSARRVQEGRDGPGPDPEWLASYEPGPGPPVGPSVCGAPPGYAGGSSSRERPASHSCA